MCVCFSAGEQQCPPGCATTKPANKFLINKDKFKLFSVFKLRVQDIRLVPKPPFILFMILALFQLADKGATIQTLYRGEEQLLALLEVCNMKCFL